MDAVLHYQDRQAEEIRQAEDETDHYEDIIGTYILKLSTLQFDEEESLKATEYMKIIGDYERIADHAVNILESAEKIQQNHIL